LPHIAPLYRYKTPREFSQDLDTLLRHFQPVSLSEVRASVASGTAFSKPSFFLSFDDGLREVYEVVAPLLKQKGIPATLFINPDFVGNKRLFFRYKAALLIEKVRHFQGPLPNFPFKDGLSKPSHWETWILEAKHAQTPQLDTLSTLLEVDFQEFLTQQRPYLDLSHLQTLRSEGWDIGAHSLDHPEYRFVTQAEQMRQTLQSIQWVKEQGLESIPTFAFPFTDFGVHKSFFSEVNRSLGTPPLLFGTAGFKSEENPFHLQRLAMEGTEDSALSRIKKEYLLFLFKKTLGKDIIRRSE
jgi:peptidoglycan/xylan/chitin deacetylase (PgdA/CDA1 family)